MEMVETYQRMALTSLRRVLTRLDRRPWSPTYGSFDREYWKYKTLIGFPRLTHQTCILSLALLYKNPFPGNFAAGNEKILEWIRAGISFWLANRTREGAVDEWFENEKSFCATAYTTYAISEAIILLNGDLENNFRKTSLESLSKSGEWLTRHKNAWIGNQMVVSAAALYNLSILLNSVKFQKAFEKRKKEILAMQKSEGWFIEYGGCDLGYSLLTLDTLAALWNRSKDSEIASSMDRLLEFIEYFIAPDGSCGGEIGSRSTAHSFPFGLELLARSGRRRALDSLARVRGGIIREDVATPLTVDDTYLSYFYINSFVRAALLESQVLKSAVVEGTVRKKYFEQAGLFVHEAPSHFFVLASKKGGVWRCFRKQDGARGDFGYIAMTHEGKCLSSQQVSTVSVEEGGPEGLHFKISCPFGEVDASLPLKRHLIAFQVFTKWILRIPGLSEIFTNLLKRKKILNVKLSQLTLERSVTIGPHQCRIQDVLRAPAPMALKDLYSSFESATVHSPSSQNFITSSLTPDRAVVRGMLEEMSHSGLARATLTVDF